MEPTKQYVEFAEKTFEVFWDEMILWLSAPATYYQSIAIAAAFGTALVIALLLKHFFVAVKEPDGRVDQYSKRWFVRRSGRLLHSSFTLIFLLALQPLLKFFIADITIIIIAQKVSFIWFLWVMLGAFITSALLRVVAIWMILPAITLSIFNWFDLFTGYLDAHGFTFGEIEITLYTVVKAIFLVSILVWFGKILSNSGEGYIRKRTTLSSSTKELLIKLFDIALYSILFLMTLNTLGIDLTALAVFSGALGVGLGFGLQKVASNFISGLILLTEKSITINNLIEMDDGVFGYVRKLGARASVVETFDGKEVLVPNEDFITSRVANLTHSNSKGRIEIMIGVSYASDLHKTQEIILAAVRNSDHIILEDNEQDGYFKPKCLLWEFADSSVNFRVTFWLDNIGEGRWRTRSEVMFAIWDALKDNNIEIPFPQRDLHIRSGLENLVEAEVTKQVKKKNK